jgi:RNA polymerase sigma factor (sigma-70 family)
MRVCASVLHRVHDEEDAFQATFLALAEGARNVRNRSPLASWLQGTAYRISLKAIQRRRRIVSEQQGDLSMYEDKKLSEVSSRHTEWVLNEELANMPEKYRAPLVLCYLEGKNREEAARELRTTPCLLKRG